MPGDTALSHLLQEEIDQRLAEGCILDREQWLARVESAQNDKAKLESLCDELSTLSPSDGFPFVEPSSLEDIRAARPRHGKRLHVPIPRQAAFDLVHGGWLGRCCGCSLGRPFDTDPFVRDPEGQQRKRVQQWLEGGAAWPLRFYAPERSLAERIGLSICATGSTEDSIECMESDDAINGMLTSLRALEAAGADFRTSDVADTWLKYLTFDQAYDSQAYRNLLDHGQFTHRDRSRDQMETVDWTEISSSRNPRREEIGALFRADIHGYAAAGNPHLAAEFAWRDARLSHAKNGVYGAMFVAAMVAAAFVEKDPYRVIECGHAEIPSHSRLAAAVRSVVKLAKRNEEWAECWDRAMEQYGHYPPLHVIPNILICIIGLLHGKGSFEKSICATVSGGLCAKSNGATVGSILGVMLGSRKLPRKWTSPLQNTIKSGVLHHSQITISECAHRTARVLETISPAPRPAPK